jgi:hypothetical protein
MAHRQCGKQIQHTLRQLILFSRYKLVLKFIHRAIKARLDLWNR